MVKVTDLDEVEEVIVQRFIGQTRVRTRKKKNQ